MSAPHARPIALTCGEPAGIGAEIAVLARLALPDLPFFWLGDPRHLPQGTTFAEIDTPDQVQLVPKAMLPVMAHRFGAQAIAGRPDPANAQGVIDVIARAVEWVQGGQALALCTLPIHKKALQEGAGFAFPGHTEYLAHLAGGASVVMMLASEMLRVVPATIHIPLSKVPTVLTPALLEEVIRVTVRGLQRDFGLAHPRLAIAGLNPHAGEGGAMGREEIEMIAPLIARLTAEGFDLRGPMSADTMFHPRARAGYDVAICMYHDQALIPIKTLDFDGGVNVTLGLPFIRTSPDHGTGFDIAGKGLAKPDSTIAALRLAAKMAAARAQHP